MNDAAQGVLRMMMLVVILESRYVYISSGKSLFSLTTTRQGKKRVGKLVLTSFSPPS
jgi:hypothetical protein